MSEPRTKLSHVAEHFAAGRYREALAIAAKFPQLGSDADAIKIAHECYAHPGWYAQLGKDEAALKQAGVDAIERKWDLTHKAKVARIAKALTKELDQLGLPYRITSITV